MVNYIYQKKTLFCNRQWLFLRNTESFFENMYYEVIISVAAGQIQ